MIERALENRFLNDPLFHAVCHVVSGGDPAMGDIVLVQRVFDALESLGYGVAPLDTPRQPVPMHLQQEFVDEARIAMGQPMLAEVEPLIGKRVALTFNHNRQGLAGYLTTIKVKLGNVYLVLDGDEDTLYPLNSIQTIAGQVS